MKALACTMGNQYPHSILASHLLDCDIAVGDSNS